MGGCGIGGTGPFPLALIALHVDRVLLGVINADEIELNILGGVSFYGDTLLTPGDEVLAWGFRNCTDGWRLWGSVAVVGPDSTLLFDRGTAGVVTSDRRSKVNLRALLSVESLRPELHPAGAFQGKQAVGMVAVTGVSFDHGYVYLCRGLTWLVGRGQVMPHRIRLPLGSSCRHEVQVGDTLLVPVGAVPETSVTLPVCLNSLRVRDGFVPAFGVLLRDAGTVIRQTDRGTIELKGWPW